MKAKVIASVNINGHPAKVGDVVEVDANTFKNLVRKGKLSEPEAPSEKPKKEKSEK